MMDKEKVLAMSREENAGREDEREAQITANADQIGMVCGAAMVLTIVILSHFMGSPLGAFSALSIYFTGFGISLLDQYHHTKQKSKLIRAILCLLWGMACLGAFIKVGFWG